MSSDSNSDNRQRGGNCIDPRWVGDGVGTRASGTGHAEVNSLYINPRDETIALSTSRSTHADRCRRQGCMSNDVERAEENAKRQRAAADREASELLRMAVVGIVLLIVFLAVLIAAKLRWSSTDFGRLEVPLEPRKPSWSVRSVNEWRPARDASSRGYRLAYRSGSSYSLAGRSRWSNWDTTSATGVTSPRSISISSKLTSCINSQRSPMASRGTITRKLSTASRHVA